MNKYEIYFCHPYILERINLDVVTVVGQIQSPYYLFDFENDTNYYFSSYSFTENNEINVMFEKKQFDENFKYFEKIIDFNSKTYAKLLLTKDDDLVLEVLRELNKGEHYKNNIFYSEYTGNASN